MITNFHYFTDWLLLNIFTYYSFIYSFHIMNIDTLACTYTHAQHITYYIYRQMYNYSLELFQPLAFSFCLITETVK